MQEHFSVVLCLDLKYSAPLSRKKYNHFRNRLACTWDEGTWVREKHNGVAFPQLQSRYALEKMVKEIKDEYGIQKLNEGSKTLASSKYSIVHCFCLICRQHNCRGPAAFIGGTSSFGC